MVCDGTTADRSIPIAVDLPRPVIDMTIGWVDAHYLLDDGRVFGCGDNTYYQVIKVYSCNMLQIISGTQERQLRAVHRQTLIGRQVSFIHSGHYFNYIVTGTSGVHVSGINNRGQLGAFFKMLTNF